MRAAALSPEPARTPDNSAQPGVAPSTASVATLRPKPRQVGGFAGDFTTLAPSRPPAVHLNITDPDPARAEATRLLLGALAAQLGLRADNVVISVDGRPRALNAAGITTGGRVYLDGARYDPARPPGRELLAHELVHVAQQTLAPAGHAPTRPTSEALRDRAAEREADEIATAFVATGRARPVRLRLPLGRVAAKSPDPPAARTKFDPAALDSAVAQSRAGEIAAIVDLMSYGLTDWKITDADVEEALHILAGAAMLTARAMAAAIGPKYRRRLLDNLNPPHYAAHREQILAVLWARPAGSGEWDGIEDELINPLKLDDLSDMECLAVDAALGFDEKLERVVNADPKRAARIADIRRRAGSAEALAEYAKSGAEAAEEETKLLAARARPNADFQALAAKIKAKLDEWLVTDGEALDLLDAVADACLITKDPADNIQQLANGLGTKYVDGLIDQIPVKGLYAKARRRQAFVYLLGTRPPFRNERIAEDLLTSPWWKIWDTLTSEDAYLAFLLVKSMPSRARQAFFEAHDGAYWKAIQKNLPPNILESADFNFYTGGKDQKDKQGLLALLLDDAIWTEKSKAKLDGVIRMALEAGEGAFVFAQSKLHAAYAPDKKLSDIVKKYDLFEPGVRETYVEKPLKGRAFYQEGILGFFGMLGGAIDFIFSSDNVDVDTMAIGGEGLNLAEFQDIFGGSYMGARFRRTDRKERAAARRDKEDPANLANVRWDIDGGRLDLFAPNIVLEHLAYPLKDIRLSSGPAALKGVRLGIRYMPKSHLLRSLTLEIAGLDMGDVIVTMPDSMFAVNHIRLANLKVTLEAANKDHLDKTTPGAEGVGYALGNLWKVIVGSAGPDLGDSLSTPGFAMSFDVTFDSLTLDGVTTSSGQSIQRVDINGLALHSGGDSASYQTALEASRKALQARLDAETAWLAKPPADGPSGDRKMHQDAAARLTRQLQSVAKEMAAKRSAGAALDVGAVRLTGVEGVSEDAIDLTDIHGQGRAVTALLPLMSDSATLRNLIAGRDMVPAVKKGHGAEEGFRLDIGNIASKGPLRLVGGIPTAEEAAKDFDQFVAQNQAARTRPGYQPVHDALQDRAKFAKYYEELAGRGVQNLKADVPAEISELQQFRDLRDWLIEFETRRATVIEHISVEEATLGVNGDGAVTLGAERLLVQNITTYTPGGKPNLTIKEIRGEGVDVSAVIKEGVAGFKDWRKNLEHAELRARNLTVSGIASQSTGATIDEISFAGEGAEAGLDATLDRAAGDTRIGVRSRRVVAKGVSIPAYRKLLQLELDRLKMLDPAEITREEKQRAATIETMLTDLYEITQREDAAETAAASQKGKAGAAAARALAKARQDLRDWERRLVVEKLTIDHLDVSLSGLGDIFAENYDFDKDATGFTIAGGTRDGQATPWFQGAEVAGVRTRTAKGDTVLASSVKFGRTGGALRRTPTGWALDDFTIASLGAQGVSYASGGMTVQSTGESRLLGIRVSAEISTLADRTVITLEKVDIDRLVADGLKLDDPEKTVTVSSGELIGIHLRHMVITLPDDPAAKTSVAGKLTVGKVKSLAVTALAGGARVAATVNSDARADPGSKVFGQQEAHALSVDFAAAGGMRVGLNGIAAEADIGQPGSPNRVHVSLKRLSGEISINGNDIAVRGLTVGDLTLSQAHWSAGGRTIDIADRVSISGIEVDAAVKLRNKPVAKGKAPPPKGQEKKELASLTVSRLFVREIDARKVVATLDAVAADTEKGVEAGQKKTFELEQARITGLLVTGFDVLGMTGKVEITKDVEVTNLRATIGDITKEAVKRGTASFKLHGKQSDSSGDGARELSATLMGKDGTLIRMGRASDIDLSQIASGRFKAGQEGWDLASGTAVAGVSIAGITTGDIVIQDDIVAVSDIDITGPLSIGGVEWKSDDGGASVGLGFAVIPKSFRINDIVATFKKVTKKVGGKDKETREPDKLSVQGVWIEEIRGERLHYEGPVEDPPNPAKRLVVDAPTVTLSDFDMRGITKDFSENLLKVDAGLRRATVEDFALRMTQTIGKVTKTTKFGANLDARRMRALVDIKTTDPGGKNEKSAISDGAFTLDSLGLRKITGDFGDGSRLGLKGKFKKDQRPGEEAGIDLVDFRRDKDSSTIGSAVGHGLVYTDPGLGLTLDIESATVPYSTRIPDEGPIVVDTAKVTNAHFQLDDLAKLGGGGDGKSGDVADIIPYLDILDHVNGHFGAEMYVVIDLWDVTDSTEMTVRQRVFPLDLDIRSGKVNYDRLRNNALWLRNQAIVDLAMSPSGYLELSAGPKSILTWTPSTKEEAEEMFSDHDIRLKRLALPDKFRKLKTPEERKAEEREALTDKLKGKKGYIDPSDIEMRNVNASLALKGQIPIDLGKTGSISLGAPGADAVSNLTLTTPKDAKLNQLDFSLKDIAAEINELHFGDVTVRGQDKPGTARSARIDIEKVVDGAIEFHDGKLLNPGKVEGTVTSASVHNLVIDRAPKSGKKTAPAGKDTK